MPFKSERQRRYFEGCKHNPQHMEGDCPDEKTLDKFHAEAKREGQRRALKRMKK